MNSKTLYALKASIKIWTMKLRWAGALELDRLVFRPETCPLCRLFLLDEDLSKKNLCVGCPVYAMTGKVRCDDTPFEKVINAIATPATSGGYKEGLVNACEEELKFLKSLLPPGKGEVLND